MAGDAGMVERVDRSAGGKNGAEGDTHGMPEPHMREDHAPYRDARAKYDGIGEKQPADPRRVCGVRQISRYMQQAQPPWPPESPPSPRYRRIPRNRPVRATTIGPAHAKGAARSLRQSPPTARPSVATSVVKRARSIFPRVGETETGRLSPLSAGLSSLEPPPFFTAGREYLSPQRKMGPAGVWPGELRKVRTRWGANVKSTPLAMVHRL